MAGLIIGEATVGDNAITLAKMAGGTDGNLITYDTSGDPAYVATGTSGHVLTSAGADAVPVFSAAGAASAGDVLQVVGDIYNRGSSITITTASVRPFAGNLSVEITCASTDNSLYITVMAPGYYTASTSYSLHMGLQYTINDWAAAITLGPETQWARNWGYMDPAHGYQTNPFMQAFLDVPSTTTMKIQPMIVANTGSVTLFNTAPTIATLVVMEIKG